MPRVIDLLDFIPSVYVPGLLCDMLRCFGQCCGVFLCSSAVIMIRMSQE